MTSRCLCAKILNWKSSYDVTLFMCQSRSIIFRGILICVIFRPRDMQQYYMLFGIFTRDTGSYSMSGRRRECRTQTGNMNPYPLWSPNNNYILFKSSCTFSWLISLFVWDANLFVAILADNKLLVISLVEHKAKMGTKMKDSVKCIFFIKKLYSRSFYLCFNIVMLKQIYESINRRHFEIVFNIPVLWYPHLH